MRKFLIQFLVVNSFLFGFLCYADWKMNPFTSKLDYYESAEAGSGTVTSVDMSVPTGLTIAGNPVTTSGTLALSLTSGYNIPLTASTSNWNNVYNASATYAVAGGAFHDGFSDFVANEHIDWTGASAGTIHATNYVDNNTTYTAGGTLLDLTGTTFSLNEGTLTDTKYCTYELASGLVCNSEAGAGFSSIANINSYLSGESVASTTLPLGNFIVGNSSNLKEATSTLYLTSDGRLGLGTTDPASYISGSRFLMIGDGVGSKSDFGNLNAGTGWPAYFLARAKGSFSSPTVVANDDYLGSMNFIGYDGVDYTVKGGSIIVAVDGAVAENSIPSEMLFQTNNGSVLTTKLTISPAGLLTFGSATSTVGITAPYFYGNLTGTASGNLISGGTLTSARICRYDGSGIDCDRLEDASGDCAANSVCMGGHTHTGYVYTAGDYLTLTSQDFDLDAEVITRAFQFSIATSSMATTTRHIQYKVPVAMTITSVTGWCNTGTTTIQIDESTTPFSAGTDIMTAALAIGGETSTTSFSNAGIAAGAYVNLDIDGFFVGAPTRCQVNIKGTLVD